eukprot:scaffold105647_cov92-Cyclotella_meneghiniana.AAC.3
MSNVTMMGRNEKQRVGPDESCVCGVTRQDTIRRKVGVNSEDPQYTVITMKTSIPNQVLPRLGLGMAALGRPGYINLERDVIFRSSDRRPVDKMQKQADL